MFHSFPVVTVTSKQISKEETMKTPMVKRFIFFGFAILAVSAVACGGGGSSSSDSSSDSSATVLVLRDSAIDQVRKMILANREVVDATISQDGSNFALTLSVDCEITNEAVAKSLGGKFLRTVKIFNSDPEPERNEIGTGVIDYLLGVYCGDGELLLQGS